MTGEAPKAVQPAGDQIARKIRVSQAFRPGTPIDHADLFAGRQAQTNDVLNAVLQPGRHVVLFGERGVGKTSLARFICEIVAATLSQKMLRCHTINCDHSDDFSSLGRKVFREIAFSRESAAASGFTAPIASEPTSLESILPGRLLAPDDIRHALTRLGEPSLIVIDEVDRLTDVAAKALLADTIKTLSDHAVPSTLILIGVADSVDELIAQHHSIDRALVPVPMPRMSILELQKIVENGLLSADMLAEPNAAIWIALLSRGLPHYTHSLALYSAFGAIEHGRTEVRLIDVLEATKMTVEKSHTIRVAYLKAVSSPQQKNVYAEVLRACALAKTDELGYFRPSELSEPLTQIMGKSYGVPNFSRHLYEFCEPGRGPVLKKTGEPRKYRFRFVDPMMQPFVIIHDYSIGRLTNQLLKEASERNATLSFDF